MEPPSISNEQVKYLLGASLVSVDREYDCWVVYHGYDGFDYIDDEFLSENDPKILQKRIREEIDKLKTFDLYLSGIIESRGGDTIEESREEERR